MIEIPDGPSWAIAILLLGNILVKFIPALTQKWDYKKCEEECTHLKSDLALAKKQHSEEISNMKELHRDAMADLLAKSTLSENRLNRVYGYLTALQKDLEKLGVTNIVDLLDIT